MRMIAAERRAAVALGGIHALRLLGIFMALPVLAVAARDLSGATPLLVGIAVGIYGLSQAALQVPFGFASDRFGRKPIIALGLTLFIIGSALCAFADSVGLLIVGRALQGAGAIAGALMALAADLTREDVRTRVMAIIGVSIGASFSAALVVGPLLHAWAGLTGLFSGAAVFGLGSIALLLLVVPTPEPRTTAAAEASGAGHLKAVLNNAALVRFDVGIFLLHFVMTATFVGAPLALDAAGLADGTQWRVYLPVFLISFALMAPLVVVAERMNRTKLIFLASVALVAASQAVLGGAGEHVLVVASGLVLFFTGFNVLEAMLPALVTKAAPSAQKGTATGVYSASQFLGAFVGGLTGGWLDAVGGPPLIFTGMATIMVIWLVVSLGMRVPESGTFYAVALDGSKGDDAARAELADLDGVDAVTIAERERVAYLRVDTERFDPAAVERAGYRFADGEAGDLAPVR